MTSPTLVVLFLALACSIFGTALESTRDQDRTSVMTSIMRNHQIMHDQRNHPAQNQRTKTNSQIFSNEIYTANVNRNLMRHFNRLVDHRGSRVKRQESYDQCEPFLWTKGKESISHPQMRNSRNGFYSNSTDCVTNINATEGFVIELTFVDKFHLEGHPDCAYDYLEIRDGMYGYAHLRGKFCGEAFPNKITSSGPHLWLKFHSDDTIEYEGFQIDINFVSSPASYKIPDSCYIDKDGPYGLIEYPANIPADCMSKEHALDVLWKIRTPENTKIYLNFSQYQLALTNDCENNVVQVFGSVLEFPAKLAHYCGSMANSVTTNNDQGNIMYVRLFAAQHAKAATLNATYTAYRTVDPSKDERCRSDELDCEDNTCIAQNLGCDGYAHCRLKADEDPDNCRKATESILDQVHIRVILIIFSLILSGMSFIFLFKCIRKLYQDHKIIKEHIKQSCEERLDSMVSSRLTLDPKRLQRDSEPRASLERENHTNEMFKRQRNFSQHKQSSIDSDFIQETQIDLDDDESWRRPVATLPPDTEEVRIEKNGRRRSDLSKIEEGVRKEVRGRSEEKKEKERRENRDVSVGAPDTKESGCQTRESLFAATSPDGTDSGSGSARGFSTFGYSGATLARPSPPAPAPAPAAAAAAPAQTSEITIELMKRQDSQPKKLPDRRPMSSETTRSAPDVIIVSKPIR